MNKKVSTGVTLDDVGQVLAALPGIVASRSERGSSWKLNRTLLACTPMHKSAEPDSLVVRLNKAERERLLASNPEVYYLTSHYVPYPCIVLRLKKIGREELRNLLGLAALEMASEKGAAAGKKGVKPKSGKSSTAKKPPAKKNAPAGKQSR